MTGLPQELSPVITPTGAEHAAITSETTQPEAKSSEVNATSPENPFGDESSATTTAAADSTVQERRQSPTEQAATQANDAPPAVPPRVPPEVEGLMAMFPDFDALIVQSVLQSVDGNQERAADILLGMSDPEYVSQSHSTQPQGRELTQEELDEQLARRLVLEEQQQAQVQQQANWHPDEMYPGHQYQGQNFGQRQNVPYQPRQGGHQGQAQWNGTQGGGKDTMSEVQEQLSKFAETGKKTFSSLVSKVKAKMQEFDQNRNSGPSSSASQPQASWAAGNAGSQGPQYFAPTAGRGDYNRPPVGYDVAPQPQQTRTTTTTAAADPATSAVATPASEIVISSSPPPVTAPRPPSTGPPPVNVDPTKIGMLPKRPVSLLGGTPAQSPAGRSRAADDDDLDYVENPFEDERH